MDPILCNTNSEGNFEWEVLPTLHFILRRTVVIASVLTEPRRYIHGRNTVPTFLSQIWCILRYVFALAPFIANVLYNNSDSCMCIVQVNGNMHSMYTSFYTWQMLCAILVPFGLTQHFLLRILMDGLETCFMVLEPPQTGKCMYTCVFSSLLLPTQL